MNEQNSAAQPPLTGDEIRAAVRQARSMTAPSDTTEPGDYVMAGAQTMLSKLRTPVAEVPLTHRCANCGAVFQGAGCPSCRLAAPMASPPIAGEAVGVVQPNGNTFRLSRPLPVGTKVYAAPQASAEDAIMASGDVAAAVRRLERGIQPQADKDGGQQRARDAALARLAEPHTGMRVDYQGLLRQAREGLHDSPGLAEMLRQLQGHLRELGQRWYAGDTAVVDELLQLYCVESNARAALSATQAEQGELDA